MPNYAVARRPQRGALASWYYTGRGLGRFAVQNRAAISRAARQVARSLNRMRNRPSIRDVDSRIRRTERDYGSSSVDDASSSMDVHPPYSSKNNSYMGGTGSGSVRYPKKQYGPKKGKFVKIPASHGMVSQIEATTNTKDLHAVYVGASSVALSQLVFDVAIAITKAFWAAQGLNVRSNTDLGPAQVSTYQIGYFANATSITETTYTSAAVAANANFFLHCAQVKNVLDQAIAGSDAKAQFTNISWETNPIVLDYRFEHRFNMNTSKLKAYHVTEFAFQNATANAIGTATIDVNNSNPVTVTPYYGNGTGTYFRSRNDTNGAFNSFIGNPQNGLIQVVADESNDLVLREPPKASFFMGAKRGKQFIVGPGDLHKTKLSSSFVKSISNFIDMYKGYPSTDIMKLPVGKFMFFAIEKVVATQISTGVASDVPLSIDSEIDFKGHVACYFKKPSYTLPFNGTQSLAWKV